MNSWIVLFVAMIGLGCARQKLVEEPQVFNLVGSERSLALQRNLYNFEELETGKTHHFERWIYDEQKKIVQYHNHTVKLRSNFHNLNHKKKVVAIHCSSGSPTITISTTKRLNISNGDLVYFGHHWNSGCHQHHKNGKNATNLFEVNDLEISPSQFKATVRPADPEEVFEHAHFKAYYEQLNTDHSRVMSEIMDPSYKEDADLEDSDIFNFRRENLSPEGFEFVTALHHYEHQKRYRYKKRGLLNDIEKVGEAVIDGLSSAASSVYNGLKKLGNFQVGGSKSVSVTLASSSQSYLGGLITLSSSVTITPTFSLNVNIENFSLKKCTIGVVGTLTGTVGAKFAKQAKKEYTTDLLQVSAPPIDIPTPVPGLLITITASGKLSATFTAEFSVTADLGSFTATGSVGATFDWSSSNGWSTTPSHSYSMTLAPPQITDVSASLSFTLTPLLTLQLGVSGANILTVSGGPTLAVPITVALKADLLNKCNLELVATWALTVGVSVQLSVFDRAMLNSQLASKTVASGSILDRCLITTPASQAISGVNSALSSATSNANQAIANAIGSAARRTAKK